MNRRLTKLLDLLEEDDDETVGTSVRLPKNLRDAAVIATQMGLAETTTDLTLRGLREVLEAFANRAILEEHYRQHPHARPSLAEVAQAAAELDGNPIADHPDLIRRAADELPTLHEDPSPDDVLLYAAGLASAAS